MCGFAIVAGSISLPTTSPALEIGIPSCRHRTTSCLTESRALHEADAAPRPRPARALGVRQFREQPHEQRHALHLRPGLQERLDVHGAPAVRLEKRRSLRRTELHRRGDAIHLLTELIL